MTRGKAEASKMDLSAKRVNSFQSLSFTKTSMLDVWQGSEYESLMEGTIFS